MALARHHRRTRNQRRDALHKATTELARTKPIIVMEDLHVAGLARNRRLARRVLDQGWTEFQRQLVYKTTWYGSKLLLVPRFYPSSKTCSGCGAVKAKLPLSERTYRCERCGMMLDRDLNAARNLAALVDASSRDAALLVVAGSGSETRETPVDGGVSPGLGWAVPGEAGSRRQAVGLG